MYQVSNTFRERCYSGESNYRPILTIDNVLVPVNQIAKITMENPIIDTSSDVLYVGSFISNTLKIKFRNLVGLPIESNKEVYLQIGQYINAYDEKYQYTSEQHEQGYIDGYEYVPIGHFLIDELKENYQETCEVTCLDYSVKLKNAIDYSPCFKTETIDGEEVSYNTIDEILKYICTMCGVVLDSKFPTTNGNFTTGLFDGSISGKQWISYIAEIKGCNAKFGRDGILYLIPLKQTPSVEINALRGKSWKLGEKYSLKQVKFYDGGRWLESKISESGNNILYIRQDNPFVDDTSQDFIDNIYDVLEGLVIYNVECENRADISLDAWDMITYNLGTDSYQTLNHNTNTYEMTIMTKVKNVLPTKQVEETTNVIKTDPIAYARMVKITVDNINGTVSTLTRKVADVEDGYVKTETFEDYQDGAKKMFASKEELTDGSVTKAVSTNFTFDSNGFTTSQNDSQTNINLGFKRDDDNVVQKEGLSIETKSGEEVLFAGFDKSLGIEGETIVRVNNMTTNHYQVAQYNDEDVWRREIINDETYGLGYAFFYLGDD